ncbi:MAG: hypothetical protein COW16_02945 [Sphingomonadales bacterium CG12_big_fil_rev_8_21_14_0_65_65_10]|nr:MAG: hypothetical protein COW16_02945 [Sphingomonadales bacterium CG12_big_fil_rev_8_21_14_0_65_65_10]
MNVLTAVRQGNLRFAQSLVILALAGLLVFYHVYTLCDLYLAAGSSSHSIFDHIQSVLRLAITLSLLVVVTGRRGGLWGMWLSIGGLVASQYWAHFGNLPVDFTEGRHPLSYLKGFIFPTIITVAFLYGRRQVSDGRL